MGGSVPDLKEVGFVKADNQLATMFRREVAALLGRETLTFPGAQPVSFARKHLQELKSRDYYVCEKSDGIRCLLYFTTDDTRTKEIHYLIDRKNDYYWIPDQAFHAPLAPKQTPGHPPPPIDWASFHDKTLIDGELLYDTMPDGSRALKYLVFDALFLDGSDLTRRTLDKRLAYFMEGIYNPYRALCDKFPQDCEFIFQMEKKEFQLAYGTEMLFKNIMPRLKHGSDGLIFTCRETPYRYGTDENILKWKPASENTVDFRLSMGFPPLTMNGNHGDPEETEEWDLDYDAMPKFTLWVYLGGDAHGLGGEMYAEPHEWEQMKRYSINTDDGLEGAIAECHKDAEGRWRLNRFREDKTEANHSSVVDKVLESIEDAVSEQELIKEAGEVRTAWKKRAADAKTREEDRKRWEAKRKHEEEQRNAVANKKPKHDDGFDPSSEMPDAQV